MSDERELAVTIEILTLLEQCQVKLCDIRRELAEANACLGRIIETNVGNDAKMARMESDLSRIRRHLEELPDDAMPGRQR